MTFLGIAMWFIFAVIVGGFLLALFLLGRGEP